MVKLKPHKGITSLGFRCKEGIILASCSPVSTGSMIDFYSEENWVGALIAGWEVHGPVLFCIDDENGFVSGYSFAVGSGSSYADNAMGTGFHCYMIADEAASFGRWAIRQAALQDGVADGVATRILSYSSFGLVYYVGPHGWELMAYDDAGNPGPYYPVCMNSVDQEMIEGQEAAEEDTKWSSYLDLIEWGRGMDQTLLRLFKS